MYGNRVIGMFQKLTWSVRRKLIQIAAFGFTNAHLSGFFTGQLYNGKYKKFCAPGLNCYSCPIGALQTIGGTPGRRFSLYVLGFLLAVGVLFGRAVCAFLCPFGLLQELLYRIPLPHKKRESRIKLPRIVRFTKYLLMVILVLFLPPFFAKDALPGAPFFCEYFCPAGTLEAGILMSLLHRELRVLLGRRFVWKLVILGIVLSGCLLSERFFCKYFCPLGAIYGLFNRISILRPRLSMDKCTSCGACQKACPMSIDPRTDTDSVECIRCGCCANACRYGAICHKKFHAGTQ